MASTFVVTRGKGAVPGKAKQRTVTVTLTGTYVTGGEVIPIATLLGAGGGRRIVNVIPTLIEGNGIEATPVDVANCEVTSTGIKLRFQDGKQGKQLAAGVTVTGTKVELLVTYF